MGNRDKIREEMEKRSYRWSNAPSQATIADHQHGTSTKGNVPDSLVTSPANKGNSSLRSSTLVSQGALTDIEKVQSALRSGTSCVSSCVSVLDGPLPREAREIISKHIGTDSDVSDQAEMYARRLLSTYRRVKVYREELNSARQEVSDYRVQLSQSNLIVNSLQKEVVEIDNKIEALVNERQLVEMQISQQNNKNMRLETKESEALQRVESLQNTIDTIATETQRGQMLLQQLIPNLCIENYA